MRVLITTGPFGAIAPSPLELLTATGWEYELNPKDRQLTEEELANIVEPFHGIIAGTEPITAHVLERASNLRIISRVGVGLDNVDLVAARRRGVAVSYTPEAPAPAVAELTVGLMLDLLRNVSRADRTVRARQWKRYMGRRLAESVVGIVGVGRIGKRVIRHLSGFGPRILACDLAPDASFGVRHGIEWVDKQTLLRHSDIISLHTPLTPLTNHYISSRELKLVKPDAILVNTARGRIVDLEALERALRAKKLGAVALDVYDQEPYVGPLSQFDNVVLTCHMGSCSQDCRLRMELEATEECIRFLRGKDQHSPVPEDEYEMRHGDTRYLVKVEPNATFHHMGTGHILGSDTPDFLEYRRRWYENPTRFQVETYPLHLDIDVASPVNPAHPSKANLAELSLVEQILDEASEGGVCAIKFGPHVDPLKHPNLPAMIAYAKERGILDVYIKAEASNLTRELSVAIIQAGLDRITLTVNGWDQESYQVESDSFYQVVANIEGLRAEREARSALRPRVRVQTYLTPRTIDRADAYSSFWRSRADEIAYIDLSYHQKEHSRRGLVARWACAKLWQSLYITWNGHILPCNHDFKGEIVLGLVGKNSLAQAWNAQRMRQMRQLHRQGQAHCVSICDKCVLRHSEIDQAQTAS